MHNARMTDEWTEQLRCPNCRKIGMASVSQGDTDETHTVVTVPDGFKIVRTEHGQDFHCVACNIAVEP